jgi:hypothetical protein
MLNFETLETWQKAIRLRDLVNSPTRLYAAAAEQGRMLSGLRCSVPEPS